MTLACAVALGACGDPAELDREDARALVTAREGLDEALDTEETIRTSRSEARRLAREVRRARGSPRRLAELAPSLVERGSVDERALRDFLRYAEADAARALHRPAARQVETITSVLDGKDEETRVPGRPGLTAERFLSEAERDVKPVWPDLAENLQEARDDL